MTTNEHQGIKLIDCDVHQAFRDHRELLPYLNKAWHYRVGPGGFGAPSSGYFSPIGVLRRDAIPKNGGPAGSDLGTMQEQLLDAYNMDYAILTGGGSLAVSLMIDADYAAGLASAYNDHLIDHWLDKDGRLRGAMVVAAQDPQQAAREIDRIGPHPKIVEVIMASAARMPYGQRFYHPIYEAAQRHNLPIAIHPGTEGSGTAYPPTPAGWPSTYLEWHTLLAANFMTHLVSMVCEGVFEKFPRLKFVLIEGGVSWIAPIMWRLDKNYRALRMEVPWLKRMPSEYIMDHVRLTTQPVEEPPNMDHVRQLFDMIDAPRILLYSSDYPHWDFDSPTAIFRNLPQHARERIFSGNARELYNL